MKVNYIRNIFSGQANKIFIAVIIFHCLNNMLWLNKDGYVQHGCHSVWIEKQSFEYASVLRNEKMPIFKKILTTLDLFTLSHNDYAFSAINFNLTSFLIAFPISAPAGGYTRLFFVNCVLFLQFFLVLLAVYYLGKSLFSSTIGAWSAIIFSFYPGIVGLSRKVNSELSVTFFVILSVALFLRWKQSGKFLRPFLLFLTFVFGTFSGGLFLVFFIPLFLMHIIYNLFYKKEKIEFFLHTIIFILFAVLFFSFYFNGEYLRVFSSLEEGAKEACQKLLSKSFDFIGSAANGIAGSFLFAPQDSVCPCTQTINVGMNIKTFLFYIAEIIYYSSPLFFLLAIFSLPLFFRCKNIDIYKRIFLGTWILSGYLCLSLFHIKWGKFITPALPVLALSSGFFIENYFKKWRFIKYAVLLLGLSSVMYYSYFNPNNMRYLEKLNEGMVSHRPIKSKFVYVAEQIAANISNYKINRKNNVINIAFLDKESSRFQHGWVADQTVRIDNLIGIFLNRTARAKNFWELSDDFYYHLNRQDFIVLITQQEVEDIEAYIYPDMIKKVPYINFKIIYHDEVGKNTFIYLIKTIKK